MTFFLYMTASKNVIICVFDLEKKNRCVCLITMDFIVRS